MPSKSQKFATMGALLVLGSIQCGCGEATVARAPQAVVSMAPQIRSQNLKLVEQALAALKDDQTVEVDETVESQCEGTRARYRIRREKGELHLGLRVLLRSKPEFITKSRGQEFIGAIQACRPSIQAFWLRYGIHLDLSFETFDGWDPVVDQVVLLLEGKPKSSSWEDRSNAGKFFFGDFSCPMALHEFAHHLGLADEYVEEGTCRTAEFASKDSSPSSLMQSISSMEDVEIFPRHLTTILGPVFDPILPKLYRLSVMDDLAPPESHVASSYFSFPTSVKPISFQLPQPNTCLMIMSGVSGSLRAGSQFELTLSNFTKTRKRHGRLSGQMEWYQVEHVPGQPVVERLRCNADPSDLTTYFKLLQPSLRLQAVEVRAL